MVGEDGSVVVEFMLSVMYDERARTRDRLEAGKWLVDRAFGRSIQALDVDVVYDRGRSTSRSSRTRNLRPSLRFTRRRFPGPELLVELMPHAQDSGEEGSAGPR